MEEKIVYFAKPGKDNTDEVLRIAGRRARELGIKSIVVSSTTGATAVKAVDAFKGLRVVIVTLSFGAWEANTQEFTDENRRLVESKAGTVLTAAHAFGGLSRSMGQSSIPEAPATYIVGDLVASTLRVFGQGMKVACEIATMATDAGLVRTDEDVIAIAGTGSAGRGVDTAVVIQPAPSHRFFDTKVKEILCKPRL
jgi:hypothetical protein